MPADMPPSGPYASAADIEAWVDRQAPLIAVVNGAVVAADLGEPEHRFGPSFVRAAGNLPAHLRLGATWSKPLRSGIRVNLYGRYLRLMVWSNDWRRVSIDSADTDTHTFANDLWQAMVLAAIPGSAELPHLKDAEGNLRQWCRLGCDLKLGLHGRLYCSCRV